MIQLDRPSFTEGYLAGVHARDIYNSTPYWRDRMLSGFNETACVKHKIYVNKLIDGFPESDRKLEEYLKHRNQYK